MASHTEGFVCNLLFLCPICHAVFSRFHAAKCEENGKHQNRADCEDQAFFASMERMQNSTASIRTVETASVT